MEDIHFQDIGDAINKATASDDGREDKDNENDKDNGSKYRHQIVQPEESSSDDEEEVHNTNAPRLSGKFRPIVTMKAIKTRPNSTMFNSTMYLESRRRNSLPIEAALSRIGKEDDAKLQTSLLRGPKARLATLVINDVASRSDLELKNLADLMRDLQANVKENILPPDFAVSHHITDRDCIGELKGRDLCRLTKYGNDLDIPVFLIKQHAIILSIRYDMRAIIQCNRITFVAHEGEEKGLLQLRACMLRYLNPEAAKFTLTKSSGKPVTPGTGGTPGGLSANITQTVCALPFELRCIEALLSTVITVHGSEFAVLEQKCTGYLAALQGSSLLSTDQQELLRELKEGVSETKQRVHACSELLTELLADDVRMAFVMLSEFARFPVLYEQYNSSANKMEALRTLRSRESVSMEEDLEFLLEYHLVECDELENKIALVYKRLEHAEQSVLVRLSVSQNELLVANTVVTVTACAVGFGGYISGLFGMNLDQTRWLQSESGGFLSVVFGSFFFVVMVTVLTVMYFKAQAIIPSKMSLKEFKVLRDGFSNAKVVPVA